MNNKSSELNTNLRLRNKRVKVIVICLLLIWCESSLAFSCCINMTVIVLVEQAFPDGPFSINNSIGIIELGMEKAREIVEHSVNLNFVVRHKKIRCVGLEWGALAAELYHTHNVHAIIGPGG